MALGDDLLSKDGRIDAQLGSVQICIFELV
jgi:hypothetical protein